MTEKKTERAPRAYRYPPNAPFKGVLFEGAAAIAKAEQEGWCDSPAKAKESAAAAAKSNKSTASNAAATNSPTPPPPKKVKKAKPTPKGQA